MADAMIGIGLTIAAIALIAMSYFRKEERVVNVLGALGYGLVAVQFIRRASGHPISGAQLIAGSVALGIGTLVAIREAQKAYARSAKHDHPNE